jgi:Large ribosomal RNA subunit accumulation protein YceD
MNERPSDAKIWSVAVRLDEVPELGRHVELEAGAEARAALAAPVGVDAIERLTASFDLTRQGRDGLHVSGSVQATVRQTCVVTLEPVVNTIDEAVEVDFAPPGEVKKPAELTDPEEDDAAESSPDEPEPLIGNSVDLGLLATEFLMLGVDPYPRRPDAAFEPPVAAGDPAAHPFAALDALRKKGTVKE